MTLEKNIFILWLQGWENAQWINKQVAESWEINNPGWNIHYIDFNNLKTYVNDIDYIYDITKNITPQAKSDIIRLSLLKNYGGVWADATMLCMQPLDNWVHEAVEPAELWMYHGDGGNMKATGPASWFIVSKKNGYMITRWKNLCDIYWNMRYSAHMYAWMDSLFKHLFVTDTMFNNLWNKVPYLYCELDGQSHTLAHHKISNNTPHIKQLFLEKPPYTLKLCKRLDDTFWNAILPDINSIQCKNSNGYYAIQMSKRTGVFYKHKMT
jgi:hypothetical protein